MTSRIWRWVITPPEFFTAFLRRCRVDSAAVFVDKRTSNSCVMRGLSVRGCLTSADLRQVMSGYSMRDTKAAAVEHAANSGRNLRRLQSYTIRSHFGNRFGTPP